MSGSGLPPYPRFSPDELRRRRADIAEMMAAADVSHLIVYGAERSGSGVQWLSEWPVTREAALLIGPEQPDVLLVQHYNHLPNARRIAADAEVRWGGPSTVDTVVELVARRRRPEQRVGIVGPLRHGDYARLAESLGPLVSLDDAYRRLRLVKSDEEVDRLRSAAALTDAAVAALADQARSGMDERRLGAIVESAYLAEGATNQIHYFAVTSMAEPDMCVPAQFPSTRVIQVGDVLFCEVSAAYWGYAGQLLRTFTVGTDPTPLFADLHATAQAAFESIVAAIRPGVHVGALVEASAVIEEQGYTTYDDLVHGYGGGYLPPVLGSASRPNLEVPDMRLEEGMVLVVQPNVVTTDERAGIQTGELVVVTAHGAESLHRFPRAGADRLSGNPAPGHPRAERSRRTAEKASRASTASSKARWGSRRERATPKGVTRTTGISAKRPCLTSGTV